MDFRLHLPYVLFATEYQSREMRITKDPLQYNAFLFSLPNIGKERRN